MLFLFLVEDLKTKSSTMPNNKKSKNNKEKNAKREAKRVADYSQTITNEHFCFCDTKNHSTKALLDFIDYTNLIQKEKITLS